MLRIDPNNDGPYDWLIPFFILGVALGAFVGVAGYLIAGGAALLVFLLAQIGR
jgi:hypothetical protein